MNRFRSRRVLLLTSPADATADAVEFALASRGVDKVRIDLADFPSRLSMNWRLEPGERFTLTGPDRIDLADITAVYHRRPGPIAVTDSMNERAAAFATAEARAGLVGALLGVRCPWVNHPSAEMAASYKPLQLTTARRCGLRVPATLITNERARALEFFDDLDPAATVYKVLGHDFLPAHLLDLGAPTSIVERDHIDDSVGATATMFQAFVDKRHDVRVTVVGEQMYVVSIHSRTPETRVDWRVDYDELRYEHAQLPAHVADGIHRLMDALGLSFATLDFAVDADNHWFFLDLNPNGQWLWLTKAIDLPIADGLASLLAR